MIMSYKQNKDGTPYIHIFSAYTSISSGNTWRYCEFDDRHMHLNKGVDYISNTFIHVKLQMFINNTIRAIPKNKSFLECILSVYENGYYFRNQLTKIYGGDCKYTGAGYVGVSVDEHIAKEIIYGVERMVDDPVFRPLRKLLSSGNMMEISIKDQMTLVAEQITHMKKHVVNSLAANRRNAGKNITPNPSPTLPFTNMMEHIFVSNIKSSLEFKVRLINASKVPLIDGKLRKDVYDVYLQLLRLLIKVYKEYLLVYFDVEKYLDTDGKKKEMRYNYPLYSTNTGTLNFTGWKIITKELEFIKLIDKKDNTKKYRVLIQKYTVIQSPNNKFNKDYEIIIGLVLDNPSINEYGLYTKFVSSGILVYKMFDYADQVGALGNAQDRKADQYIFIGDIMNEFTPLKM